MLATVAVKSSTGNVSDKDEEKVFIAQNAIGDIEKQAAANR